VTSIVIDGETVSAFDGARVVYADKEYKFSGGTSKWSHIGDAVRMGGGSDNPDYWSDVIRVCKTPIKIWIADDDANVPPRIIYNFITSLKNGNCIAEKRQVPNGTGKHYAFTDPTGHNDDETIVQSGKTSLGIAYTDIPIYWPEMVAFFRRF
jgi:hypothetical protein